MRSLSNSALACLLWIPVRGSWGWGADPSFKEDSGNVPHLKGEDVECGMEADDNQLLLFLSSGFGVWQSGNHMLQVKNLVLALRELVLQLPDDAWESDGAHRKHLAHQKTLQELEATDFKEPELYSGLKMVILEDTCFLKESLWNRRDPNFNLTGNISLTYENAEMRTNVSLVEPFFGKGLDSSWCVNQAVNMSGFVGGLGFDDDAISHLSIFDQLADDELKTTLFEVATGGSNASLKDRTADLTIGRAAAVLETLRSADIIFADGGNPDFGNYVYGHFARHLLAPTLRRLANGAAVFIGQSAGSMDASADSGLTYEPTPALLDQLLDGDSTGLGLAGRCAIRPHFNPTWDLVSNMYSREKNLTVVRIQNGDALQCSRGRCQMLGLTSAQAPSVFTGPTDPHLWRLMDVFT